MSGWEEREKEREREKTGTGRERKGEGEGRRGKGRKGDSKLMCGLSTHSRRGLTSLPWMGDGALLLWNETHINSGQTMCA